MNHQVSITSQDLHQGQSVLTAGEAIEQAKAVMVMLHGRGARAEDIMTLVDRLGQPGFAYLAPQAAGNTWYPNRFLAPLESNEPWLSSALMRIGEILARIGAAGIPPERVLLLGFSQGACLALEYAARNARRYGGVAGLSGSLIGPDIAPHRYTVSQSKSRALAGTPVFLGCSDVDIYVPKERVEQSAKMLRRLGGAVTMRLYENMDHSVNQDEIEFVRTIMREMMQVI